MGNPQTVHWLLVVIGFLGSVAVFAVVQRIFAPKPKEETGSLAQLTKKQLGETSSFAGLDPRGTFLERLDLFLLSAMKLEKPLEELHILLGRPEKLTPLYMLHQKELVSVALAVVGYVVIQSPPLSLLLFVGGFWVPDFLYRQMIATRQREIIINFPSMVDLMALTIESGQDYIGAFDKILKTASKKTELEAEIERTIHEVQLGYARRDALRNFALRTGLQEVRSFVGLIIQSDELGTSLVDLLRNFSGDLRFRRISRAEKLAAQASTKMLFPLIFFIFPTVFVLMMSPMLAGLKGILGF